MFLVDSVEIDSCFRPICNNLVVDWNGSLYIGHRSLGFGGRCVLFCHFFSPSVPTLYFPSKLSIVTDTVLIGSTDGSSAIISANMFLFIDCISLSDHPFFSHAALLQQAVNSKRKCSPRHSPMNTLNFRSSGRL